MSASVTQIAKAMVLETLWPTRCACCDTPGNLLCDECERALAYIDRCNACPVCGSPYGRIQCCDCSETMLGPLGLTRPPYDACVSVVNFDERSGSMVTTYKDAGDQGLSHVLARLMYAVTPHEWLGLGTAVSFLPASAKAYQRRGWDHAQLLARAYAAEVGLPLVPLFARPGAIDQRALGRKERFANMEKSIRLLGGVTPPSRVIIIDDVYTTGSTLFAAATCIKNVRPDAQVFCLTFARA